MDDEITFVARALAQAESLNWDGLTEKDRQDRRRLAAEAICAIDRWRRTQRVPEYARDTD